jgi:hypothetical protein
MNPWIAGEVNREHIAELRSLGRPFGVSLAGQRIGRRLIPGVQRRGRRHGVFSRRRLLSVRF